MYVFVCDPAFVCEREPKDRTETQAALCKQAKKSAYARTVAGEVSGVGGGLDHIAHADGRDVHGVHMHRLRQSQNGREEIEILAHRREPTTTLGTHEHLNWSQAEEDFAKG